MMFPEHTSAQGQSPLSSPGQYRQNVGKSGERLPDQHGHYTHELPEYTSEAFSQWLIRLVPLVYGALIGGLGDHLAIGLVIGGAISLAFDFSMDDDSLLRSARRLLFR